ncbi:hypothetical protein BV20DRAFT_933805 [Pilatotrama ljubarskyi]|nr:hypothetical protein BV20DRAFT_933805 [Pilatotrama ljubarskyi]
MHHHATLTANLPSVSLASLFQAAAGRAWARTRPTRAYHRTSVRSEGVAHSKSRTVHHGHNGAGEMGRPSSSTSQTCYVASPPVSDGLFRAPPSPPHFTANASPSRVADASHDSEAGEVQASRGPASSHPPRTNFVTHIDVERLSPRDFEVLHGNTSGTSAYESDPPWEAIRESVPESLLPRISPRRLPVPKQLALIPDPSTPEELVDNLALAVTAKSPPRLGQLLSYHAAHRSLHSTASFNLLIKFAIRHASFGTVQDLLGRMVREGIAGDVETRALRVRCMVRTGRWDKAWREEMVRMREDGLEMPLPVWLEFFGGVKRGAIMVPARTQGRAQAKTTEPLEPLGPSETAARLDALLQHPPLVTQVDLEQVPPRAVYALVRSFVARGRRSTAAALTTTYLKLLPPELDEERRRSCLSILHLHLKCGQRPNLTEHYAICKTLFGLLGMHPGLRPNATTLFFLLGSLRRARRCGARADAVVQSFVRRWGPDVVDDAVRRRVASYWVKEGNPDRAQAVVDAQATLDEQRATWRAEKEATEGDSMKDRARRLRWLELHRSPRKNKQRWFWRLLRRRIWRAKVRRS